MKANHNDASTLGLRGCFAATTAVENTIHQNWTDNLYQIVSFQMNYSKAPIFFAVLHSYQERAYDGPSLSCSLDFLTPAGDSLGLCQRHSRLEAWPGPL